MPLQTVSCRAGWLVSVGLRRRVRLTYKPAHLMQLYVLNGPHLPLQCLKKVFVHKQCSDSSVHVFLLKLVPLHSDHSVTSANVYSSFVSVVLPPMSGTSFVSAGCVHSWYADMRHDAWVTCQSDDDILLIMGDAACEQTHKIQNKPKQKHILAHRSSALLLTGLLLCRPIMENL